MEALVLRNCPVLGFLDAERWTAATIPAAENTGAVGTRSAVSDGTQVGGEVEGIDIVAADLLGLGVRVAVVVEGRFGGIGASIERLPFR